MRKRSKITNIYIDASSFAQPRKSGIGYVAEGLTKSIANEISTKRQLNFRLNLVVSLGKSKYIQNYKSNIVKIKTIPLPYRGIQLLNKMNVLPPMDLFLGKGTYIFPNYRNWRLIFSKSLTYIHDLTYLRFPEFTEPKNLEYLKNHVPRWVKRTDVVLTASEYTKNEITKYLGISNRKIEVIHHGIDSERVFVPRSIHDIDNTLKKYGVVARDFILHVGNIEPRKNIIGLVEAYGLLSSIEKKKHPLLFIGGDGWSNQKEKTAIDSLRRSGATVIKPKKYVDDEDLPAFYTAASVLVMPSFYEGFGLPPLQALACGTPIVVSDNSSLKEIFTGIAVTVDPLNPIDIKSGIQKSLRMNTGQLSTYRKNAKKIAKSYSWEKTAQKMFEVMERFNV